MWAFARRRLEESCGARLRTGLGERAFLDALADHAAKLRRIFMIVRVDGVKNGNLEKLVFRIGRNGYGALRFAGKIATIDDFTCHGTLQSSRTVGARYVIIGRKASNVSRQAGNELAAFTSSRDSPP